MNRILKLLQRIKFICESKLAPIKLAKKIGVKIGNDCRLISFPQFGSEPYLIEIGNHVTISSDVAFVNHDGGTWVFRENEKYKNVIKFGRIIIGDNCFVGMRSTILHGVIIGDNCVVGACSLVSKNIPSGEVWGGVPAHFLMKTVDYADKALLKSPYYDHASFRADKKKELMRIYK